MGVGGGGGGNVWSSRTSWCFMLVQSRYTLTVQALWLVLSISPIHAWEWTIIQPREGEGVELLYSFLVASHFSNQDELLLCRPFGLF